MNIIEDNSKIYVSRLTSQTNYEQFERIYSMIPSAD